jgi:hypothetical protein
MTLVAAVFFVLIIRALLERTAGSVGGSVTRAPVAAVAPDAPVGEGTYAVPAMPSPDEEGFYPSTGMVYRCVGQDGTVAFQSQPCGPDARMTKAIHAPAEREPPRHAASVVVASSSETASNAQYARIPQSNPVQNARDTACAQARRNREDTLERVGLARTYDLLQRLDEMVREACR